MARKKKTPHSKTPEGGAGKRNQAWPAVRPVTVGLFALLIVGACAWAYATSFAGVFVLDDKYAILDNPNITTLWPLTRAMSAPPENPVSGRPVASLTLAINFALAPEDVRNAMTPGADQAAADRFLRNVWGYHFVNVTLHALAGLALFGVVRRTLRSDRLRPRFGAAAAPLACTVALIWIVHPLLTDAVTYIAQRTEVLMGMFYLMTLYCAIRAGEVSLTPSRRRLWTAGAIGACALGMGSKQTMVSAPLLVWLWDWLFGARQTGSREAGSAGSPTLIYVGLAATWVLLGALVAHERWPHSIGLDREGWTPWTYLLTQTGVIAHYLRLAVVPWPLALDYDGWPMARSVLDVMPYAAMLSVLFAVTVLAVGRRWPSAYAAVWFFATLAPSSSVLPLPTEVAAERRMYLPLAALVAFAVVGAFDIGQRLMNRLSADVATRRVVARWASVVVAGSIILALGSLTRARNRDFWSDERIWEDTVQKRPTNPRARINYAADLAATGRYERAEQQLREAVRLRETSAAAHGNLGSVLCLQGELDDGIAHLERALALDPEYTDAHRNLGEAYAAQGKRALAVKHFTLAVEASPNNSFLLSRLGWLLATSPEDSVRDGRKAVEVSERAVRLTSGQHPMSLETLAAAYAEVGRLDDAVGAARRALMLAQKSGDRRAVATLTDRLALYERRQAGRK